MDLGLSEKVAVVTGASKGIGLAVTRLLAAEGAAVVAGARTVDALDGVEAFAVDLGRPGGPEALIAHAMARYGRLDVLVNSVGRVQLRLDGFLATSDADFEASLQINFFAALRATRAAVALPVAIRPDANDGGAAATAAETDLSELCFDYAVEVVSGHPPWTPRAVYDDGTKTFVRFDGRLLTGEAPVLYVIERDEAQIVNYRVHGTLYIVDRIFERAELRLGKEDQDVVRIRRRPRASCRSRGLPS